MHMNQMSTCAQQVSVSRDFPSVMTPQTVERTMQSFPTMNNFALQSQGAFILELSTGIACSTHFQLLSE